MGMSSSVTVNTEGSFGSGAQAMWTQRPSMSSRVSPGVLTPGAVSTFVPSASENIGPVMPASVVGGGSVSLDGGTVGGSVAGVVDGSTSVVAVVLAVELETGTSSVVAGTVPADVGGGTAVVD